MLIDEVPAHRMRFTIVAASASESLELDSPSVVVLLPAAKRGARVSTDNPKTSGTLSSFPLVPDNE